MSTFRYKYFSTVTPEGLMEPIKGSRNNPKGLHRRRHRRWLGPRSKLLSGVDKQMARLMFDQQVKHALA